MKKEICERCEHFVQHYGLNAVGGIFKIFCGHCLKHQMSKKECKEFKELKTKKDFQQIRKAYLYREQINCLINNFEKLSEKFEIFSNEIKKLKN